VATWEGLHGEVDSLVAFEIVVSVEGLWTLITFEGSIVLLLLLRVSVHGAAHLVGWVLHVDPADDRHLIPGVVDI